MQQVQLSNKEIISDYNRIYSGPGIRTNSGYYRWIVKLLGLRPNKTILDVSCGEGIFLREALKKFKLAGVCGLDISDIAVSIAKGRSQKAGFVVADGQKIPFKDKSFDYVTCLGSLEHYLDQELGLREICRVAKDNAKFCIVLPNSLSIDLFLHLVKKGEKPVDDFQILEKTFTRNEWAVLLERNGFCIKAVYGSNLWPEFFQEGSFKVKSLAKFVKRSLIRCFCPLNLAREFVFICTKKETR